MARGGNDAGVVPHLLTQAHCTSHGVPLRISPFSGRRTGALAAAISPHQYRLTLIDLAAQNVLNSSLDASAMAFGSTGPMLGTSSEGTRAQVQQVHTQSPAGDQLQAMAQGRGAGSVQVQVAARGERGAGSIGVEVSARASAAAIPAGTSWHREEAAHAARWSCPGCVPSQGIAGALAEALHEGAATVDDNSRAAASVGAEVVGQSNAAPKTHGQPRHEGRAADWSLHAWPGMIGQGQRGQQVEDEQRRDLSSTLALLSLVLDCFTDLGRFPRCVSYFSTIALPTALRWQSRWIAKRLIP
jgi:hypothetical protein